MKVIAKNKIIPVVVIVLMVVIAYIVLLLPAGGDHPYYDFLRNFHHAEKTNFSEVDINYLLPAKRFTADIELLKKEITGLFSGIVYKYDSRTKFGGMLDKPFGAGAFRLIINGKKQGQGKYVFIIQQKENGDRWEISLKNGPPPFLTISSFKNHKEIVFDRFEFDNSSELKKTLNILFFSDYLLIFSDSKLLFQCKNRELVGSGYINLQYRGKEHNTPQKVKFAPISNEHEVRLRKILEKDQPNLKDYKFNTAEPEWNAFHNEYLLENIGIKSQYLRRLKLDKLNIPSMFFRMNGAVKYNLKILENAVLEFSLAAPFKNIDNHKRIIFAVEILPENGKMERFEFLPPEPRDGKSIFQERELNLQAFSSEKCEITFKCETVDGKLLQDEDKTVIACGMPIIRGVKKPDEKNIILISLDTLRADHLGCYGYSRETSPNIDRFASESVLYRNAAASSNWTLTSHMSMFTGLHPLETGYYRVSDIFSNVRFSPDVILLTEYLKRNGYKTGAIAGGGFISDFFGFDRGFDYFLEGDKDSSIAIDRALSWLEKAKKQKFSLFFHTYEIHKPYSHDLFLDDLPSDKQTEKDIAIARYDSGIRYADAQIGRLLDWLKENGLYKNTLIIITSDHGENFNFKDKNGIPGGHGRTMYDQEIRIPLIIGGADIHASGIVKSQVSLIDIMPSILDYLSIELDKPVRGSGILDLLGAGERRERVAYSEAVYVPQEKKALRSPQFKIIRLERNRSVKSRKNRKVYEFYNLTEDNTESRNIFDRQNKTAQLFLRRLNRIAEEVERARKSIVLYKGKTSRSDTKDLKRQLDALGYLGN